MLCLQKWWQRYVMTKKSKDTLRFRKLWRKKAIDSGLNRIQHLRIKCRNKLLFFKRALCKLHFRYINHSMGKNLGRRVMGVTWNECTSKNWKVKAYLAALPPPLVMDESLYFTVSKLFLPRVPMEESLPRLTATDAGVALILPNMYPVLLSRLTLILLTRSAALLRWATSPVAMIFAPPRPRVKWKVTVFLFVLWASFFCFGCGAGQVVCTAYSSSNARLCVLLSDAKTTAMNSRVDRLLLL